MLLFMIIGFLTYRKYRHYLRLVKNNENTPSNNASNNETRNINYNPYTINPGQSTGQQRTVITGFSNFSNRNGNETHNNETRKKKDIKSSKTAISNRKCLHCKKSYVHNHNVQKYCNEKCGVVVGIGIGALEGLAMRIAHMGYANAPMLLGTLSAVEMGLQALEIPHGDGGTSAAIKYLSENVPQ